MDARVMFGSRVLLEVVFSDAGLIWLSFGANVPDPQPGPCYT